jgi:DNA-binding IclR family transcriptional regulator
MRFRDTAESGDTIQSVERSFRILEIIGDNEDVGVTDIAARIDVPKSTVHHYLRTLESLGYIDNDDGRYSLGIGFLNLGGIARSNQRLYRLAKDDVDELAAQTGEQARLIGEHRGYGITLYQSTGENLTEPYDPLGTTEQLHCTAAGKAFLAELSKPELDRMIGDIEFVKHTENTITDPDELRRELRAVRDESVAYDDEERYEDIRCVAASAGSKDIGPYGAISVSAPVERMDDERFRDDIPDLLQNFAGVVGVNTNYYWAEDSFE